MKEKLKNKKVVYTIIGIISVLLVAAAVTYAYWLVTKTQQGENVISSGCLDIDLVGSGDITLPNQFPISDEEGKKLAPYEFTVTNNCNTAVDYQIALEAIGEEETSISSNALKVALNDDAKLFSSYAEVDTTVEGAYEARRLGFSRLAAKGSTGSSDTYNLRIWIDEDAPISEMSTSEIAKTFRSKITVTIGQGIEAPYEEGTLAYDILSHYGGVAGVSYLSTERKSKMIYEGETNLSYCGTGRDIVFATDYTFDKTTGVYSLSGTTNTSTFNDCANGTNECGKYMILNDQLYEILSYTGTGCGFNAKVYKVLNDIEAASLTNDISLNVAEDDLGMSYYFRGNTENNYVKFGSYAVGSTVNGVTYDVETPMYWRIVRINGDGTIRLVYDGTTKALNDEIVSRGIGYSKFNESGDNVKYVGYTYDTSDSDKTQIDSTIKGVVDTWYDANIEKNYGSYLADSIFCNDRTYVTGTAGIEFAGYTRLNNSKPTLKCTNKADRYTTSTEIGNGYLTNPVGLLTGDEVFLSGLSLVDSYNIGELGTLLTINNNSYLLVKSSQQYQSYESMFTLTPSYYNSNYNYAVMTAASQNLTVPMSPSSNTYVSSSHLVRPVINLKADVQFTGNGSYETPYEIVMN